MEINVGVQYNIFSPEGGCSEGLDAFKLFLSSNNSNNFYKMELVYVLREDPRN